MKLYLVILCLILTAFAAKAQSHDIAVADIDLDGISDTVKIDLEASVLFCKLSRSKFKPRKSKPIKSLTSTDYEFIGLTALPGTFQLLLLKGNSSNYFSFVYDDKKKKIYLDEHYSESPGDDMGVGAYEFNHNLRRRCVYYWVRYNKGSTNPNNYDPSVLHTERVDKRVRKLRMSFEKFSDEKYYRKTRYIWKDMPLQQLDIIGNYLNCNRDYFSLHSKFILAASKYQSMFYQMFAKFGNYD